MLLPLWLRYHALSLAPARTPIQTIGYLSPFVPLSLRGGAKERGKKRKEGLAPLFAGYSPDKSPLIPLFQRGKLDESHDSFSLWQREIREGFLYGISRR